MVCPPVHLCLAHGSKHKALCDSVHRQQEDIEAVPAEEGGAPTLRQDTPPVYVQSEVGVCVAKGEDCECREEDEPQ